MIEVQHLVKDYGNHLAVKDISFTVEPNKIYGFLGPNGAGKSTTMNILTGCLAATSGKVLIDGYDIFEKPEEAKKRIGYLPELPPVYLDRTVREYLRFVGEAKGLKGKKLKEQIDFVIDATRIREYERRLIRNLSKGYRQRVGIAQAILGDPKVIILDEPTVGLDPMQIIEIRELIKSLKKEGHTIILSSHILSEVQATCDEIIIIHRGKLVANDTAENLEKSFRGKLNLRVTADTSAERAKEILATIPYSWESVSSTSGADGLVCLDLVSQEEDDKKVCRAIFEAFKKADVDLLELAPKRATLEDIFIELTNEKEEEYQQEKEEKVS